ncbi:actin-related protein 8-like [Tubulanus polymorphus]|uniref:actin-related protein 8-like n=1 Tax=Tubulanus polymorphus TaxID=672921 RepID=UPI003DA69ECC
MPPTAAKRPSIQSAPDTPLQPLQGSAIVVIHPGSYNLYIGRASDPFPLQITNCIARKQKDLKKKPLQPEEDNWYIRNECNHSDRVSQMKQGLKSAEEALLTRPTKSGEFRQSVPIKQIVAANQMRTVESTDVKSPISWTITNGKEHFIGEEALHVRTSDFYRLYWPIRRGRLNLREGAGGSITAVLHDIETIWADAIQHHLDIPLNNLKHYRAILLIPDIYNRHHVKELMNVLLNKLGFSAAFVVQESVCATFGAGIPSACVIDVGDQKTSVSCVEDGLSHKDTRFVMEYGGSDLSRTFLWLLNRVSFPYKDCSLIRRFDILSLKELKEKLCHLDQEISGILEEQIQLKDPDEYIRKFTLSIGDERILVSMAYFFPDMFGLKGPKLVHVQERSRGDPDDPHDDDYLERTQVRYQKRKEQTNSGGGGGGAGSQLDDTTQSSQPAFDDDSNDVPSSIIDSSENSARPSKRPKIDDEDDDDLDEEDEEDDDDDNDDEDVDEEMLPLMAVDQAILHSIDICDSDEMKKRMYSCIIVVGGGMAAIPSANSWLQYRIWTQMPSHFRLQLETMDVITSPKDMDPKFACWKGAAVMSCLDTSQELWIRQNEWKQRSVKALREKAPFLW